MEQKQIAIITLKYSKLEGLIIERVLFNTLLLSFDNSKYCFYSKGLKSFSNTPLTLAYNQEVNMELTQ